MTKIFDRNSGEIVEPPEYQGEWLKKLYETKWGNFLLPLVTSSLFSTLYTIIDYTSLSKKKISEFLETYQISLNDYQEEDYQNFADFFIRKLKPEALTIASDKQVLSVAQAKLLVLPIKEDQSFLIKGQNYQMEELLQDTLWARYFKNGTLFIYRLAVNDYHRYLVAESGKVVTNRKIFGKLHTIREIAQKKRKVFKENKREYTLIQTQEGTILQMEIGALLVGKIINPPEENYQRGKEKGWFSLGGSTILVAYPEGTVTVDQDIQRQSALGIETQVEIGEGVGWKND